MERDSEYLDNYGGWDANGSPVQDEEEGRNLNNDSSPNNPVILDVPYTC